MLQMFKISAFLFLMVPMLMTDALAQEREIRGTVTEASGEPLAGATVRVAALPDQGTVTNPDGVFTITASSDDVLIITFIGYRTQEILVGDRTELNIVLQVDQQLLSEVVVVGYGVQTRSDLTGSIASISADEIANQPVASLDAALQGRASGVFVSSPSGTPGAGITMNIRGQTSLSASSEPLYVIDGVPIISEDLSGLFSGGQATN